MSSFKWHAPYRVSQRMVHVDGIGGPKGVLIILFELNEKLFSRAVMDVGDIHLYRLNEKYIFSLRFSPSP